jgi:enoyl-CoA hydratase/carnithine racemase
MTATAGSLVQVERRSPAYWRVTLNNPPINLYDPETETSLTQVVDELEANDELKVVVFDSALADFYMAHLDLVRALEFEGGVSTWFDLTTRLGRASFITVASIRGRARGLGSEFVQALDVRFASRESAVLGQPEIGAAIIPGGGGMQRLWRLTGRARALEIIASGADYDAETAERYGWINRAIPDAEPDAFVERFALRIASFDREALAAIKEILNEESLAPSLESLKSTNERFNRLLTRPAVQEGIQLATQLGMQTHGEVELNFGDLIYQPAPTDSDTTGQ